MNSQMFRSGRVWIFGDNISTDLIMPGAILWNHVTSPEDRRRAIMPNRPGWAADEAQPGDLIVAGTNFGCGSSRSAPRILREDLGLSCVVAESFSRLFLRNSVNLGFPVLVCPGITEFVEEGETIDVDFDSGVVVRKRDGEHLIGEAYPPDSPPGQLLRLGGLRPFLDKWLDEHPEVRTAASSQPPAGSDGTANSGRQTSVTVRTDPAAS